MQTANTLLEDIGAEIGFTATSALCGWYGGRKVYIPKTESAGHHIAKVIGLRQMAALVRAFGGTDIFVPKDWHSRRLRRDRVVRDLLRRGLSTQAIALKTNLTTAHVCNIRNSLEETGLLQRVFTKPSEDDS
ncbi:MAG: hypothetical protein IPG22_06540 [Acidobacteria bacterium]|jgi:Mor family transcriptional regulator|nr:hypothetical protein [Acidobacteriota bacterium]